MQGGEEAVWESALGQDHGFLPFDVRGVKRFKTKWYKKDILISPRKEQFGGRMPEEEEDLRHPGK